MSLAILFAADVTTPAVIPNRPVFRSQEVCELADVQAYVLRTWEAEFPDLGVSKAPNGPRVYRRADVERVLKIKHLLFVDGLTIAGVRRRLNEEGGKPADDAVADADVAALMDDATRQELQNVRRGLHWILDVLSSDQASRPEDAVLTAAPAAEAKTVVKSKSKPAKAAKTTARTKKH